jgi:hypothetical protein
LSHHGQQRFQVGLGWQDPDRRLLTAHDLLGLSAPEVVLGLCRLLPGGQLVRGPGPRREP